MQAALSFMKTHLISLIAGALALVFIGLAAMFMMDDSVDETMKKVISQTGASQISGLRSSPKNQDVIDAEKKKGSLAEKEHADAVEAAKAFNKRDPIMGGVFPKPAEEATPYRFQEKFTEEFKQLATPLNAGTAPTPDDINDEVQNVLEMVERLREYMEQVQVETKDARQPAAAAPTPAPAAAAADGGFQGEFAAEGGGGGGRRFGGHGGFQEGGGGAMPQAQPTANIQLPAGVKMEPKYDPVFRAKVSKARDIRCYIDTFTFHESPVVTETKPPTAAEMWYAQVGLWVQRDVIGAISALNDEAAQKATQAEPTIEPCVEHVPVKRLVSIRIHGYQDSAGKTIPFPVMAGAPSESRDSAPILSFADSKSNEQFDVIRFGVSAIVDQRDVQRLIDRITKSNLYRCIDADYDVVNRKADDEIGYLYGTAPVVRVNLEFEGFLSREVYGGLMPTEVASAISGKPADAPTP